MRQNLARALPGLALIALVAAITPARASGQPAVPDAVEFEQPAPPARSADARASSDTAAVIHTGRHFNMVGLHWRGAAASSLSMRVRTHAGWSRWTRVPVDPDHAPDAGAQEGRPGLRGSDPLWAGEANAVQYRLGVRGGVRGLRLRFIDTNGTATASDRGRHAVASALRPVVPAPGAPPIITREEWGGSKCPPRATPAYGEVKLAFIHHTVTANDYAPTDSAAIVRGVCLYHRNSNGWNDIGYNFLVDKYGQIFEGRAGGIDGAVVGAQAQGYNSQSTGIANLGNFSTTGQTSAGLSALARLLSWKLAVHGIPPIGQVQVVSGGGSLNRYPAGAQVTLERISGHRDGDATACPGDGLYAQLPELRRMVVPGQPLATTSVALHAAAVNVAYGTKAVLNGLVWGPSGVPLAGQPIDVQMLSRLGAWKTLHRLTSDGAGSVATRLRFAYNHAVRLRFPGGPGLLAAQSAPLALGVRPRVVARVVPSTAAAIPRGGKVLVTGRVRPSKRAALLLVDRLGGNGTKKRIGRKVVKLRAGKAIAAFRFTRSGRYALRIAVLADAKNLAARSTAVSIRVR